MWTWLLGTSTGPLGAANAVTDFSVFSKKPSPTQIYRCLPAPHRCGAQVQCQVNGLTYADFSSVQTLLKDRKYVSMVHSPFLKILWASVQRIKAATMTCGCTRFSSIIMATTNREKKHEQRLLLKERSAPYQPNKERGKAVEDESDRSLSSQSSIRAARLPRAQLKVHTIAVHQGPRSMT